MKKITRVWESRKGKHSFEYENIEVYDKEGRIRCRASLLDESVWSPEMLERGWGDDDFVIDSMPGDETDRCFVGPVHCFDYRQEADGTTTQIESWDIWKIERQMNSLGQVIREVDGPAVKTLEYDPSGRLIRETVRNPEGVFLRGSTYGYRQEQILSGGVPMRAEVTDIQKTQGNGSVSNLTVTTAYTLSGELAWKREEERMADGRRTLSHTEYSYWGEHFEYEWEESYEKFTAPFGYGLRQYSKVLEVED